MGIGIDQAKMFGTKFKPHFNAVRLLKNPKTEVFTILGNNRERITAKAVVLGLGASPRRLEKPGVAELEGRGVSYGAPQYHTPAQWAGRKVGIIGGGNSAGQAGLFLASCEGCEVNVFVRGEGLEQDMSRYLVERFRKAKIKVHHHSNLVRVEGNDKMEEVIFTKAGVEEKFSLDYLLIQIGSQPPTGWLEEVVSLDDKGYIPSDLDLPADAWPTSEGRAPLRYETSLPGVFVGGDAHALTPNRMSCAVGEGHALGVSVYKYLELRHEREAQLKIVSVA